MCVTTSLTKVVYRVSVKIDTSEDFRKFARRLSSSLQLVLVLRRYFDIQQQKDTMYENNFAAYTATSKRSSRDILDMMPQLLYQGYK